ncbi:GNAT family N-acetyltransferase, partial [Streptomyces scabiei]|uniref:GNAT family N-acyltransferase n=1 Tax=Streptomyces scabiei TaxID=1930 RepID=UPI0029A5F704
MTASTLDSPPRPTAPTRYTVTLARGADVLLAAGQGDGVAGGGRRPGLDIDPFDAHCDHLLVRDTLT